MSNSVNPMFMKLCIPDGLEEVLEGLAREVLRRQPTDINRFAAVYFQKLLTLRTEAENSGAQISLKSLIARGKFIDIKENEFQGAKTWQADYAQMAILKGQKTEISANEVSNQINQNELNDSNGKNLFDEIATVEDRKDEQLVQQNVPTEKQLNTKEDTESEVRPERIEMEEIAKSEYEENVSRNVEVLKDEPLLEQNSESQTNENETQRQDLMNEVIEKEVHKSMPKSEASDNLGRDVKFQRIEEEPLEQNELKGFQESTEPYRKPEYVEESTVENVKSDIIEEEFSKLGVNLDNVEEDLTTKQNLMIDETERELSEENDTVEPFDPRTPEENTSEPKLELLPNTEAPSEQELSSDTVEEISEANFMVNDNEEPPKEQKVGSDATEVKTASVVSGYSDESLEHIFKVDAIEETPKEYDLKSEIPEKKNEQQNLVSEYSDKPSAEILNAEAIEENPKECDLRSATKEKDTGEQNLVSEYCDEPSEKIFNAEAIEGNPKEYDLRSATKDKDTGEQNLVSEYSHEPSEEIMKAEAIEENPKEYDLISQIPEKENEQQNLVSEYSEEPLGEILKEEAIEETPKDYVLRSQVLEKENEQQNLVSEYSDEPSEKILKEEAIEENPKEHDLRSETNKEYIEGQNLVSEYFDESSEEIFTVEADQENPKEYDWPPEIPEKENEQKNLVSEYFDEPSEEIKAEAIEESPKEYDLRSEINEKDTEGQNLLSKYSDKPSEEIFKAEAIEENSKEYDLRSEIPKNQNEQQNLVSEYSDEPSEDISEVKVIRKNRKEYELRFEEENEQINLVTDLDSFEHKPSEEMVKAEAIEESAKEYDLRSETIEEKNENQNVASEYIEEPPKEHKLMFEETETEIPVIGLNTTDIEEMPHEQKMLPRLNDDEQSQQSLTMANNIYEESTEENFVSNNITSEESLNVENTEEEETSKENIAVDVTEEESPEKTVQKDDENLNPANKNITDETAEINLEEIIDENAREPPNLLSDTVKESLEAVISYEKQTEQNTMRGDIKETKITNDEIQGEVVENVAQSEDTLEQPFKASHDNTPRENFNPDGIEESKAELEANVVYAEETPEEETSQLNLIRNDFKEESKEQCPLPVDTEEQKPNFKQDTEELLEENVKRDNVEEPSEQNEMLEIVEDVNQSDNEELVEESLQQEDTKESLQNELLEIVEDVKQGDDEENMLQEDTKEPLILIQNNVLETFEDATKEQNDKIEEYRGEIDDMQQPTEQNLDMETGDKEQSEEFTNQSVEIKSGENIEEMNLEETNDNIQEPNESEAISLVIEEPFLKVRISPTKEEFILREENADEMESEDTVVTDDLKMKNNFDISIDRQENINEVIKDIESSNIEQTNTENDDYNATAPIPKVELNDSMDEGKFKHESLEDKTNVEVADSTEPSEIVHGISLSTEYEDQSEDDHIVITDVTGTKEELDKLDEVTVDPIVLEMDELTEDVGERPVEEDETDDIFGTELDTIVEENSEADISISSLLPDHKTQQDISIVETDNIVATTEPFQNEGLRQQTEVVSTIEVKPDESDKDIMTQDPREIHLTSNGTNEVEFNDNIAKENQEQLQDNYNENNNSHVEQKPPTEDQIESEIINEINNPSEGPIIALRNESSENDLLELIDSMSEEIVSSNDIRETEQLKEEELTTSDRNNNEDMYLNDGENFDEISDTRNSETRSLEHQMVTSDTNESETLKSNNDDDIDKDPTVHIEIVDSENNSEPQSSLVNIKQSSDEIVFDEDAEEEDNDDRKIKMPTNYLEEKPEIISKQNGFETEKVFETNETVDKNEILNGSDSKTEMLNNDDDDNSIIELNGDVNENILKEVFEDEIQPINSGDNIAKSINEKLFMDKTDTEETPNLLQINLKEDEDIFNKFSSEDDNNNLDAETSNLIKHNGVDEETGEYVSGLISNTQYEYEPVNITKETEQNEQLIRESNTEPTEDNREEFETTTNIRSNNDEEELVNSDNSNDQMKVFESTEATKGDSNNISKENFDDEVTRIEELSRNIEGYSEASITINYDNNKKENVGTTNRTTLLESVGSDVKPTEISAENRQQMSGKENYTKDKEDSPQNVTMLPLESNDVTEVFALEGPEITETVDNLSPIPEKTYEASEDENAISNFNLTSGHRMDNDDDDNTKDDGQNQESISEGTENEVPVSSNSSDDVEMEQKQVSNMKQSENIIREDVDDGYKEKKDEFIRALIENITLEHNNEENRETNTDKEYSKNNVEIMEEENEIEMTSQNNNYNSNENDVNYADGYEPVDSREFNDVKVKNEDESLETGTEFESTKDSLEKIINNSEETDADFSIFPNGTELSLDNKTNNALGSNSQVNSDVTKSFLENNPKELLLNTVLLIEDKPKTSEEEEINEEDQEESIEKVTQVSTTEHEELKIDPVLP